VPLSSNGFWLNATSRLSPTETEGTALGTKNSTPSVRAAPPPCERKASAAQAPADQRQQAGDDAGGEAGEHRLARSAVAGLAVVFEGETARQHAVPLAGEARRQDDGERGEKTIPTSSAAKLHTANLPERDQTSISRPNRRAASR